MLTVAVQSSLSAVTLRCQGRIVLGVEAETLRCIAKARQEGCVLLDLRDVQALDAAGLGLLVELYCEARRRDANLRVIQASPRVHRLMTLTSLHLVLGSQSPEEADDMVGCGRRVMTA
jgi:anti-anti-sigma factor